MSNARQDYWRKNLRLILTLLVIWFSVPILGGIVFVEALNEFRLGGYKLGFWIAQQGSIYLFVVLIFIYARIINKYEDEYHQQVASEPAEANEVVS